MFHYGQIVFIIAVFDVPVILFKKKISFYAARDRFMTKIIFKRRKLNERFIKEHRGRKNYTG